MSEHQYDRCFDAPRVTLGSMSSQRWRDDPKTLLFTLSRYKQVARLLDGSYFVAEVGCGDGFASALVLEVVGELTLYDLDERFCQEAGANLHDIAHEELPTRYDAIYMLDVFEHIADSHAVLRNVCASLCSDGRAIIGMPSLESQQYASEMSQLGHVACMTGGDLKRLMEQYFRCVLVLSMNDETLHSGFFPMSHYLLAIGIGVRDVSRETL